MKRDRAWAVGQLRHLYKQMLEGAVSDQAAAARGLLGPAIEKLEQAQDADERTFDNEVLCPAVYKWVKGDGSEPYSPVVASLTVLVHDLLQADRARREKELDDERAAFPDLEKD